MRSVGIAVTLSVVALVSVCLLLVGTGAEGEESASWSSRSLLSLGPIRSGKKDLHRHGRVEYRYQQVNCEGTTTATGTVPTVTTVPQTTQTTQTAPTQTTQTVATQTTVPTTTTTTVTTVPATTVLPTTVTTTPPGGCNPPCTPSSDLCFPNVCVSLDNLPSICKVLPVVCNDHNGCTVDSCFAGVCSYTYNASIPGCSCEGFNCPTNACAPSVCQIGSAPGQSGPFCLSLPGVVCNDNNNCTDDSCVLDLFNSSVANCSYVFNATLCPAAVGGLEAGQIAGIVIGAVAAAAIAAAIAAWARRKPSVAPASSTTTTTPLATASPLYSEPINAGVMPAV
jgi:hypothetical protein